MTVKMRWSSDHRPRGHRMLRRAQAILFVLGSLALAFCALAYFGPLVSQRYEQREFEHSLRIDRPTNPSTQPLPATRLQIPRLGMSVMVHEGVHARTLSIGAGHIPGTASPGDHGNIGIAAHRDTFFRDLRKIEPEDEIFLDTLHGTYQYAVEWTAIVKPADTDVLESSDESTLTLVTCYPFYYVGSAPDRFIVRARRVGFSR